MISTELLRMYEPFAGIDLFILEEIARISNIVETEKGKWLFFEGDTADNLYIVLEGEIGLTTSIYLDEKARDIETSNPTIAGELLGWSALIKPYKYTSGGRAKSKAKVISIQAQALRELLEDNPSSGYQVMRRVGEVISERLESKCMEFTSLILESRNMPLDSLLAAHEG